MRTVTVKDSYLDTIKVEKPKGERLHIGTGICRSFIFNDSKSSRNALRKFIAALSTGLAELEK